MIVLLSPSKTLDFSEPLRVVEATYPQFINEGAVLMELLKKLSIEEIGNLMSISRDLAVLTHQRIGEWSVTAHSTPKQNAIYAFKGEAYSGFNVSTLTPKELKKAQSQLIILSGLYGILKPLDEIMAYRLEMATKLKNPRGANLYHYWRDTISNQIKKELELTKDRVIVNLASDEYFKAIDLKTIDCQAITPQFLDFSGGAYKTVSVYAKKARGAMARFLCSDAIENIEHLLTFNELGYHYDPSRSSDKSPAFIR